MSRFDKEKLDQYLNSESGNQDDSFLIGLFGGNNTRPEVDQFVRDDWKSFEKESGKPGKDLSGILAKVHHQINQWNFSQKQSLRHRLYRYYSAVAAVLMIPLVILSILKWDQRHDGVQSSKGYLTVQAPNHSRVNYVLPDSSQVCLKGGASLTIPVDFAEDRRLKLIGEAFFDVTKDIHHPFVVELPSGQVEVLGTRFTAASLDEKHLEVVLEEGKVKATVPNYAEAFILTPNQKLEVIDGLAQLERVEAIKLTSWKDGKLIFKDDPFPEIAERLEKWYGVDIVLKSDQLAQYSFRGVFMDESLEEVLRMMAFTLPIKYKIVERKRLPDGSFSPRQVVITKRN